MKTPDEIKKGLEFASIDCRGVQDCEKTCAYYKECSNFDYETTEIPCTMLYDSLAYIQQLETKSPQWISVEGRLPDKNGKYFVAVDLGVAGSALTFTTALWLRNRWDITSGFTVKYWMPCPELPKEE